ncbi:hypothetical protein HHI36_008901 [Cryptolaemus montrouzieri]|uniref:Uncharacterized protein n=1 Tax=Cryptolaemus montrouzieri TaxID=559131 RepID=A0ABD2MTX0_9CUCU
MDVEQKAEEAVTNPTSEPVKSDESKASTDNATTPVTNGDASKEELSVKVPEEVAEVEKKEVEKPEEAAAASKAEPKSEPEAPVKAEEAPKPVTEEPKPVVEETSASAVEAVKEVRSEEVPPPLPSSNPPSQVMVFAESTKANILLSEDIPVCEKPEVPVGESVNPPETQEPSNISPPIVESVASIESTPVLPVEEEQTCAETHAPISPTSSVENKPPSPVTSSVEVLPEVQDIPILDASESEQKSILEQNDSVVSATVSSTESSPLIIEALPKKSDESLQVSETSDFTLGKDEPSSNSLAQSELDTSNSPLIESQENCQIESEQASLKTENEDSMVSVPSVPVMIEEKVPVVSSAGDVPSQLESHISLQSDDSSLQELKSNLNLKDSPTSQEPSIASQEQSTDLSTIPEVESRDSKLEETADTLTEPISLAANVNEIADSPSKTLGSEQIGHEEVELSPSLAHKDIEPMCNAGSLPDLSTESLPSLPEPSDSVLEPMSLPPLDSVPDPIVDDIPVSPSKIESPTPKPLETEPPVVLTNGNATNGLKSSPTADDDESPLPLPLDGPLKQIVAPEPLVGDVHENSQSTGEAPAESNESAPATDE